MVNGLLVKQWLYRDQLKPVAELDGSGNFVSQFIYGTKSDVPNLVIRGGLTYRIISDQLGSPVLAANIVNRTDLPFQATYAAFGERTLIAGTDDWMPFGFAGGQYDPDTELTKFGAREYIPSVGRWVSKDPILFQAEQANLYGYAGNDATNQVDTTGLATYICQALADDPFLRFFNINHRWLMTSTQAAGMGGQLTTP
jgi:RHS repeat-associated protein